MVQLRAAWLVSSCLLLLGCASATPLHVHTGHLRPFADAAAVAIDGSPIVDGPAAHDGAGARLLLAGLHGPAILQPLEGVAVGAAAIGGDAWRLLVEVPGATPDYTFYHPKEQLLSKVQALVAARPDIMRMDLAAASEGEYSAELQVVTVSLSGLSTATALITSQASALADGPTSHAPFTVTQQQAQHPERQQARILMDFGEHGREFVSSELGLLFLQTLADPAALAAALGGDPTSPRSQRVMATLQRSELLILPMENPRGRERVEGGNLCERKNGRGVDPNRNWPVDWGKKEKDYDPAEEFPGTGPFSEPEVRIVQAIAAAWHPHVWLNVHSGMEAMFTPYDHKAEVPVGAVEALALLEQLHTNMRFTNSCVVGSGGKSVGYLAHGTATDYMFDILGVPMSYTWEIYGDFAAAFSDCFRMFNPLTAPALDLVLQSWLQAMFTLLELLPTHPATAFLLAEPAQAVTDEGAQNGLASAGGDASISSGGGSSGSGASQTGATTLLRSGQISASVRTGGAALDGDQSANGSAVAAGGWAGSLDPKDALIAAAISGGVTQHVDRVSDSPLASQQEVRPMLVLVQGTLTMQHTAVLQSFVGVISLLLVVGVAVRCARWGWARRRSLGGAAASSSSGPALLGRESGPALSYLGSPRLHARALGQRLNVYLRSSAISDTANYTAVTQLPSYNQRPSPPQVRRAAMVSSSPGALIGGA
ncbi:MAG: hypothetical protein WDW36_009294 [Sanguina aurantia]